MLFQLANERPSEATDVYGDSIKTSHSSAFGGNRPRVRDQDKIKSILYQFKSFFFPATSRITQGSSIEIEISCGDSCHNPQAAPVIQCGHLQSGRWGQSHFQRPVCLQTGHGPGVAFDVLRPSDWLTHIRSITPCCFYLQTDSSASSGSLGLSWGCNAWLTAVVSL